MGEMTWGGGVVRNVHNVLQEVQGESEQGGGNPVLASFG